MGIFSPQKRHTCRRPNVVRQNFVARFSFQLAHRLTRRKKGFGFALFFVLFRPSIGCVLDLFRGEYLFGSVGFANLQGLVLVIDLRICLSLSLSLPLELLYCYHHRHDVVFEKSSVALARGTRRCGFDGIGVCALLVVDDDYKNVVVVVVVVALVREYK